MQVDSELCKTVNRRRLRICQKDGYIILRTGIKETGWNKRNRMKCNKGKYVVMHLDIYKKYFYYYGL